MCKPSRRRLNRGKARGCGIVEYHETVGNPAELCDRARPIDGMHQHSKADRDVERPIAKRELMGVTGRERHRYTFGGGPLLGD